MNKESQFLNSLSCFIYVTVLFLENKKEVATLIEIFC